MFRFSRNLFHLLCIPKYEMYVLLAVCLVVECGESSESYWLRMDHITKVTACLCLICSCHGVHDVLGGWVRARCSCSGRPSPPSPTCPSASQTGSCTHGRCSSGPPGDRWWDWFVFFKYKKVFKLPQLSAQRSSEVSRRWFRAPRSPQTALRHKTQMARPEWKLKIDISQEW